MKHVFFAFYNGREYKVIEPALINYHLAIGVDIYMVTVELREVKVKQRIKLVEGHCIDLSAYVSSLKNFGESMRLTVTYYAEGDLTGRFTKEYDIDESHITRIKL